MGKRTRLSERFIETQSAMLLNMEFIPFHTTKTFFDNDKCFYLDSGIRLWAIPEITSIFWLTGPDSSFSGITSI